MKKHKSLIIIFSIIAVIVVLITGSAGVYMRLGGFSTGECADVDEFSKYAVSVSSMSVPDGTQIIALGEATHGNKEFQQLRLDVLKVLVEKYDVRAFALEGDFGGCEAVNRYVHGGDGSADEALSKIGFAIYRTDEMKNLVEWIREYNQSADPGDDIGFYGFDMEQYACSYNYLLEELRKTDIDYSEYENMWDEEKNAYSDSYTSEQCEKIIRSIKDKLPSDNSKAVHYADVLLQNIELGKHMDDMGEMNTVRDKIMAENVMWILNEERASGHGRIMISGHNNHVMKSMNAGSNVLGSLLSEQLGDGYFAIGTDFYKSECNLPKQYTGKRIVHTFYSCDPLAKASKKCGYDMSFLDFSKIPEDSSLNKYMSNEIKMGSLGELYSPLMNFLPRSYRVARTPDKSYDAVILVSNASPIVINPAEK